VVIPIASGWKGEGEAWVNRSEAGVRVVLTIDGGSGGGSMKYGEERRGLNLKLSIQIYSNLIRSKSDLSELEQFEIKYDFEGFDERNNFPYRNFLRFTMDFELKCKKASSV
jgi:hypothetical protein